ncbi:MAG TPA: hypothetical protein VFE60_08660 [Roseiarcus sp.]|jgi:hypothetical protein|nr:hypothetical protein [Roseiarcus sp.]
MTTNTQMAEPVEADVLDSTRIGSIRGAFGTIPTATSNETELTSQVSAIDKLLRLLLPPSSEQSPLLKQEVLGDRTQGEGRQILQKRDDNDHAE